MFWTRVGGGNCHSTADPLLYVTVFLGSLSYKLFNVKCKQYFNEASPYRQPDSQVYKDAKRLEEFFDSQLVKWLPEFAYWNGEGEPPRKRPRCD